MDVCYNLLHELCGMWVDFSKMMTIIEIPEPLS